MPTYVVLLNFTDQGIRDVRGTLERAQAGREQLESLGLTLREMFWTVGPYDLVAIGEAPDDESATAAMLALGEQGNVRTTTLRAFSADEMRGVLERLP